MNLTTTRTLLRWAVWTAGAEAVIVGGGWLVTWFSGHAARWSTSGAITMKTNAALGMCLTGAALLLQVSSNPPLMRRLAKVASVIVLLLGVLTASEHLFVYDLGIDQALARELPGAAATVSPNRMGPLASTSFILLSLGLLALTSRRFRSFAPHFGLATCLISLVPTVGYLFGIAAFYGTVTTGIAWPTVITLLSLGTGLVLAQSDVGPLALILREDEGGTLLRRLFPWVVVVPLILGALMVQGERAGLYNTATGTGMLVITLVLVFSILLWLSAARLSHASEGQKRSLEEATGALAVRDEFLSIASHELKTPLTSLFMQLQMRQRFLEKNESVFSREKFAQMLESDKRQFQRMNRLIEDMLDVSRIRSGRLTLETERADICALAKNIIDRFSERCAAASVSLQVRCDGPIVGIFDPQRMDQVLSTLLDNALKYGDGSPIEVAITNLGKKVELHVHDKGRGISKKDQERIFHRFQRGVEGTGVSGLGLGLYISQRIMNLHGGSIRVESEPGRGACFIVELPTANRVEGSAHA